MISVVGPLLHVTFILLSTLVLAPGLPGSDGGASMTWPFSESFKISCFSCTDTARCRASIPVVVGCCKYFPPQTFQSQSVSCWDQNPASGETLGKPLQYVHGWSPQSWKYALRKSPSRNSFFILAQTECRVVIFTRPLQCVWDIWYFLVATCPGPKINHHFKASTISKNSQGHEKPEKNKYLQLN